MDDVIVIGCGLSGLTAAYEMLKADADLKVKLLEAKDRVGGRTLTVEIDIGKGKKEKFDLGGQWVADSQLDIMELLSELNLETYSQYISGTKVMQVGSDNRIRTYESDIPNLGNYWSIIELQLFIWKIERLARKVPIENPYSWERASEYDSITMMTYVRDNLRTVAARDTVVVASRSVFGADLDRISALFFLAYCNSAGGFMKLLMATENGAQQLRVKGGTQQVSNILADLVGVEKIHLNDPVTEISQEKECVKVLTVSGKEYCAKHVVVSIPPEFVARIRFSPPLPENRQLLMENMPSGHLSKYIVTYDKAYWREDGYSGEVVSNGGGPLLQCSRGPISIVYDATTNNQVPALVGFLAGRPGVEWHQQSEAERKRAVLNGLSQCFGPWALKPTSFTEKIWADEIYNGGCPVSFGVPGIGFTFHALRQPHGRVHWCGTETATHWTGYLSGAVQSGRRAACEIMKMYGKDMSALEKLASRLPQSDQSPPYSGPNVFAFFVVILAVLAALVAFYIL